MDARQKELANLRKYTDFLEKVVSNNKDADEDNTEGIEGLRSRFINLKNENKKLNDRKNMINQRMEQVKEDERKALAEMTKELYDKQQAMQDLHKKIELTQAENQALEQDFENEIDRKNTNNKQVGQIISSINNIAATCLMVTKLQKGKEVKPVTVQQDNNEEGKVLVKALQSKLEEAVSKIGELSAVLGNLAGEYTVERYYEEFAVKAMAPVLAASNNAYGGGSLSMGQSKAGVAKSDYNLTSSHMTNTRRL